MATKAEMDIRVLLASIKEKQEQHNQLINQMDGKMDTLLQTEIPSLRNEIGLLKLKSGVWGAIAGMIPAGIALVVMYLNHF